MPHCGIAIFAAAFGVEAVGLGDASAFVVSADEVDSLGVAELEADEEGYRLYAEETAINIVACIISAWSYSRYRTWSRDVPRKR